jgi:hypothetical protein
MGTPNVTVDLKRKRKASYGEFLLIDASRDHALADAIIQRGYRLTCCASVKAAWKLLYPKRPRIIVHLSTPGQRDLSALQECRVMAEGVPVVLVVSGCLGTALKNDRRVRTIAVFSRSEFINVFDRILGQGDPIVVAEAQ